MTDYRVVVRHVGYWRGTVHKWSTVYPLTGALSSGDYGTVLDAYHDLDDGVCYPDPSGNNGGVWEVALYDQATGGVPIAVQTYFDPDTPGSWVKYSGAGWSSTTVANEKVAEVSLQVEWPAGLGRTGKPVLFRKWYHAVKISVAAEGGSDIAAGDVTALGTFIHAQTAIAAGLGVPMGNSSRLAATTPVVLTHYGAHQMPRGRRKRVAALTQAQGQTILNILENQAYGQAK